MTQSLLLNLDAISHTYPGSPKPALESIHFSMLPGELCGLIGPNGAGKTTLLSIITTLLRPSSGNLAICGIDAFKSPRKVRQLIGYVPQELALYEQLTGLENLLYFGKLYGIPGKELNERATYFLDLFGLFAKKGQRVATYSGGMKRRINLIIGLLHEPRLLLLDEPTVGIDAHSRHLIITKLTELMENRMAMIYTSHYLEEVEQLCSQIVIIDDGKIVESGSTDELLAKVRGCSTLTELYLRRTGGDPRD